MTNAKGRANKNKRKAPRKFYDQNIKMSAKKQARKTRRRLHDTYTVELPKRLNKLARQNRKEYR